MSDPCTDEVVVELASEAETVRLGLKIAGQLSAPVVIWLRGQLGAGKTTLTRGVLEGLGHQGAVKSPTYTIVEPYEDLGGGPLYHLDLYRLGDPEELEYLGIRDYVAAGAKLLIEWPDRGGMYLPGADIEIDLAVSGTGRQARLRARSPRCLPLLTHLSE